MKKSLKYGTPVNPPIWWIDPTNQVAHSINDGKTFYVYVFTIQAYLLLKYYYIKGDDH